MSDMIWGSVQSKPRGRAKADAPIKLAERRRAIKLASTGIVYEPISRGTGMMRPIEDPKVIDTFLPTDELRERYEAQVAAETHQQTSSEGEESASEEPAA